jgi:hypothetical protein
VTSFADGGAPVINAVRRVEATTTVRLELDLRPTQLGTQKLGSIAGVVINSSGPNQRKVFLYLTRGATTFDEDWYDSMGNYAGSSAEDAGTAPDFSGWTHYRLTLDVASSPPTATVDIGVDPAVTKVFTLGGSWKAPVYEVSIGLFTNGSSEPWAVNYDNVVVDAK